MQERTARRTSALLSFSRINMYATQQKQNIRIDHRAWCSKEKHSRATELSLLEISPCKWRQATIDCWTVWVLRLLQARHGQRSLNPHVRKFVCDTDQHGLVDAIEKVVVNLGILCHATQQFVDQLTCTKTHGMTADFMRLK